MTRLKSIIIFLLPLAYAFERYRATTCSEEFPFVKQNLLLEKIINDFSVKERFIGEMDVVTTRKLLTDPGKRLYDVYQLSLQPVTNTAEGCVYGFDTRRFSRLPIYVKTSEDEEAHPFNRLYFRCPPGTQCCGLYCCPDETMDVQKKFLEASAPPNDLSDLRRIHQKFALSHKGVTYSLSPPPRQASERSCIFYVGEDEELRRSVRLSSNEMLEAIYFSCPQRAHCCQLKCVFVDADTPKAVIVSQSSTQDTSQSFRHIYVFLAVAFVTLFGVLSYLIYFVNKKRMKPIKARSIYWSTTLSDSRTMTGFSSLQQTPLPDDCFLSRHSIII